MNISRPSFYKKIDAISHLIPNEQINLARLKNGAELLYSGDHKINEIAASVEMIFGIVSVRTFKNNYCRPRSVLR